ncbi:methyltransferase [Streptomyces sp. NPDC001380]|uniref:class I SAM-dependent methyltransferase n=1 Tax=Streptomyces sp. NPDC001380 TaxID=3364566 RepID=UPI00368B38A5
MTVDMTTVDQARLEELLGRVVADLGAVGAGTLVVLGERLGLFRALADGGPATPAELARRTGTVERNVREWLAAMAASGYVAHDGGVFRLDPEQEAAFADEQGPAFVAGGFQLLTAAARPDTRGLLERAFRDGRGLDWGEHHPDLFAGTARFFRPGYAAHLVQDWLPALEGVVERLEAGGAVADVGCGLGLSTLLMAQAFPAARLTGFDSHAPSVDEARRQAAAAGLGDRVAFRPAAALDFDGGPYDLVAYFDCLHDMGDPVGALRHARGRLAPGGTVMLVEPYAEDTLEENLNPLGRLMYTASTLICTPVSQAQEVGLALGAQAGETATRAVAEEAGFRRFRRAAGTPTNLVYEVRV